MQKAKEEQAERMETEMALTNLQNRHQSLEQQLLVGKTKEDELTAALKVYQDGDTVPREKFEEQGKELIDAK